MSSGYKYNSRQWFVDDTEDEFRVKCLIREPFPHLGIIEIVGEEGIPIIMMLDAIDTQKLIIQLENLQIRLKENMDALPAIPATGEQHNTEGSLSEG